jgi:hypothetical protein
VARGLTLDVGYLRGDGPQNSVALPEQTQVSDNGKGDQRVNDWATKI